MNLKLTKLESKIYETIKKEKEISFTKLLELISSQTNEDNIRRSLEILKSNSLINEKKEIIKDYHLGVNGEKALNKGLIEEIFCDFVLDKNIKMSDLKQLDIPKLENNEISLAFGICKRNDLIDIIDGCLKVDCDYKNKLQETKTILNNIKNKTNLESFKDSKEFEKLLKRKDFIISTDLVSKKYILNNILDYSLEEESILNLTPDLLKTNKEYNFKKFDVEKLPSPKTIGRISPLRQVIYYMRDIFLEMGFKEMKGPYVETSFWNMDSMFISQDHPARDVQDTFYLPIKGELPDDEALLNSVEELHNNGGNTGSKGYRYDWSREVAKKLVLRTHTTATTYRTFYNLKNKINEKYFCIDKVFRNETIDASHLPEFYQAEGFVIGPNLSLADLLGFIKDFLGKLGIDKVKFKPNYNPYTEPSVEAFVYFEKTKKWIEVINAGIFRPESLEPYGIKQNVIAWGFGVERIAMLLYNKTIKDLHGDNCDLDWLRTYPIPSRKL